MAALDPNEAVLRAIGYVATSAADFSSAVEQVAVAVTGTELLGFILQDSTLGTQVKHVTKIVSKANTNTWISHPPIDGDVQANVLRALQYAGKLVPYRNDIIHNSWAVDQRELPDGIQGSRPTRFSKTTITSNVTTFYRIASCMYLVMSGLQSGAAAIEVLRSSKSDEQRKAHARRSVEQSISEMNAKMEPLIRGQRIDSWHWTVTPLPLPGVQI